MVGNGCKATLSDNLLIEKQEYKTESEPRIKKNAPLFSGNPGMTCMSILRLEALSSPADWGINISYLTTTQNYDLLTSEADDKGEGECELNISMQLKSCLMLNLSKVSEISCRLIIFIRKYCKLRILSIKPHNTFKTVVHINAIKM